MKILTKNDIIEAGGILNNGGLLAFPTETVFGLGVLAINEKNYNKLVEVKNRHPDKPFTLMVSNISQVSDLIEENWLSKKIIDRCMPGPITLILKAKKNIARYIDYGTGFVGIRMPKDDFVLNLINYINKPLFVPSCNKADQPPCKNTNEVIKAFKNEIDAVIDGNCIGGIPSTIIKVVGDEIFLVRQGKITIEDIKEQIK